MALTHIDKPIRIGGVEIRNRVVRTGHATNIGGGTINDDLIAYHEARARGGVGLSILEILGVHRTSPSTLNMGDPALGAGYEKLARSCHQHGMRLFQQLWHGGHHVQPLDGSPPISASDVPSPELGVAPVPMSRDMIAEIVTAYARAARFCADHGLDGVEVHCGHGYLPAQFLAPHANRREDDYGGSFLNRARFTLEILRAIRAAVPQAFAVGVRAAPDAAVGGISVEDVAELFRLLEAENLIDFADVSFGSMHAFPKLIGGMHEPMGYELPTSSRITPVLRSVTIVTGRFRTLEEADQVIRAGQADMVGMTRATLADPDLVAKTLAGEPDRVRPCIACNQGCVGGLYTVNRTGCAVNPAAGYERNLAEAVLPVAAAPRRVLVIGGGPAGMEAARTARLQGHQVTLAEAQSDLGGALRLAAMAPTRHGMIDILSWLEAEIYRLGVEVRLSSYMDEDDVRREKPDVVIVATGSLPRLDAVQVSNPGEPILIQNSARVLSSHDLFLEPGRNFGHSALVIDDLGHYEALAATEFLAQRGLTVNLVTRHKAIAPLSEPALMVEPALQRLAGHRFRAFTRSRVLRLENGQALVAPTYLAADDAAGQFTLPADTVVLVSRNQPCREIADALEGADIEVRLAGDARSPRFLEQAMRDGRTAALGL